MHDAHEALRQFLALSPAEQLAWLNVKGRTRNQVRELIDGYEAWRQKRREGPVEAFVLAAMYAKATRPGRSAPPPWSWVGRTNTTGRCL
jgi:hypothetical protein